MAIYRTTSTLKLADGYHEADEALELDADEAHDALGITDKDVQLLLALGVVELPRVLAVAESLVNLVIDPLADAADKPVSKAKK